MRKKPMLKIICLSCKRPFFVYPYRKDSAKFCSKPCGSVINKNRWAGGETINAHGYVLIRIDKKYVYKHRYVMENHLKRPLARKEIIHHIDGNKKNNEVENLKLLIKNNHDSIETTKRWTASPESFGSKNRCNAPRIDKYAKGALCKRPRPCSYHGTI